MMMGMRWNCVLLVLPVLCLGAFGLFRADAYAEDAKAALAPRIVVEGESADVGSVREGQEVEHAFKVLNAGDAVLEIKDVKPG